MEADDLLLPQVKTGKRFSERNEADAVCPYICTDDIDGDVRGRNHHSKQRLAAFLHCADVSAPSTIEQRSPLK